MEDAEVRSLMDSIRRQQKGVWFHEEYKTVMCPRCEEPVYRRETKAGDVYYVCATKKCGPHNPLFRIELKEGGD